MLKFNEIAEQAIEQEKQYYLADFDFTDSLEYYWPSIQDHLNRVLMEDSWQDDNPVYLVNRTWSVYEKEQIIDYILDNAADLLSIGYGYHVVTGFFAIASSEELEIDLQQYHWTKKRADIVSRWSDMVIHNGLGYTPSNFHLDIRLDIDVITEALLDKFE